MSSHFNPLRPRGRRRGRHRPDRISPGISTHSAREDGDMPQGNRGPPRSCISTHSAREDGDGHAGEYHGQGKISTHSAREDGDVILFGLILKTLAFQPTPPARTETLDYRVTIANTNYFNPLRPRGRRLDYRVTIANTNYFNPLRPRGRRQHHFC